MGEEEKNVPQLGKYMNGNERKQLAESRRVNAVIEPKKNKFKDLLLAGVIGGLVTVCAGLGVYHFMFTDKGYPVRDAQTVMQETTNPKLKAASTDKKLVYEVSGASDTMNGLTMSIEGVQFRRDQTRLWVHFKNDGKNNVSSLSLASARIVDDAGHQYKADPFSGWAGNQIPVGMDETVMMVFDPIKDEAGNLSLMVDGFSNMKDPNWNMEINFKIPE